MNPIYTRITPSNSIANNVIVVGSPLTNNTMNNNFTSLITGKVPDVVGVNRPNVKPALSLNFSNATKLDPRITFTRASGATYYDGRTSAVAEQNLLTYSQDFTNANWGKSETTITNNATTAPDGTSTGNNLTPTAVSAIHRISSSAIGLSAGNTYTISVYAKANGYNYLYLNAIAALGASATFNVSTGVVTANNSGTSSITSVGNGWYRCTVTSPYVSNNGVLFQINSTQTGATDQTFTGDGTSGVYLWGAQLEQRSSVTAYNATTTSAITNYIPVIQTAANNTPRFDYNPVTGESLGLLIEQSSTNLLTYSQDFSNGVWSKRSGATVNTTANIAPDGTQTANLVTSTGAGFFLLGTIPSAVSGVAATWSFYAKPYGASATVSMNHAGMGTGITFNFSSKTFTSSVGYTVSYTSIGNGWYRISATSSSESSLYYMEFSFDNNAGGFLWGLQLEALPFVTSYIPTVGSQVIRISEQASMTGMNLTSWYNQGQGTFYYNATVVVGGSDANPSYVFGLGDIVDNSSFSTFLTWQQRRLYRQPTLNEIGQTYSTKLLQSAASFNLYTNVLNASLNGVITDNNAAVGWTGSNKFTVGQMGIGNSGRNPTNNTSGAMWIKKINYYTQVLPASQLQALTAN
jgi:hypothetical protein